MIVYIHQPTPPARLTQVAEDRCGCRTPLLYGIKHHRWKLHTIERGIRSSLTIRTKIGQSTTIVVLSLAGTLALLTAAAAFTMLLGTWLGMHGVPVATLLLLTVCNSISGGNHRRRPARPLIDHPRAVSRATQARMPSYPRRVPTVRNAAPTLCSGLVTL